MRRTRSDMECFRATSWRLALTQLLHSFCYTHAVQYKQGMNEVRQRVLSFVITGRQGGQQTSSLGLALLQKKSILVLTIFPYFSPFLRWLPPSSISYPPRLLPLPQPLLPTHSRFPMCYSKPSFSVFWLTFTVRSHLPPCTFLKLSASSSCCCYTSTPSWVYICVSTNSSRSCMHHSGSSACTQEACHCHWCFACGICSSRWMIHRLLFSSDWRC